jgi:hypothetical protein
LAKLRRASQKWLVLFLCWWLINFD